MTTISAGRAPLSDIDQMVKSTRTMGVEKMLIECMRFYDLELN
jgi:hypothetical protein